MFLDLYNNRITLPYFFKVFELKRLMRLKETAIDNERLTPRPMGKLEKEIKAIKSELKEYGGYQTLIFNGNMDSLLKLQTQAQNAGINCAEYTYAQIENDER